FLHTFPRLCRSCIVIAIGSCSIKFLVVTLSSIVAFNCSFPNVMPKCRFCISLESSSLDGIMFSCSTPCPFFLYLVHCTLTAEDLEKQTTKYAIALADSYGYTGCVVGRTDISHLALRSG